MEKPTQDKPTLDNPTQLNKDIINKNILNTNVSNIHSLPFPSGQVQKRTEMDEILKNRETIKENIEYNILCERCSEEAIDEIVDLLTETISSPKETIIVSGIEYPTAFVKNKLLKLTAEHIEYVLDCMKENTTKIKNIRQYLLARFLMLPLQWIHITLQESITICMGETHNKNTRNIDKSNRMCYNDKERLVIP